ncbi:transporter substrate-binding domain-containing protein [Anaeromusa acidaminophila]|uniref:transporter substrate-binding domain-containing protein n=1 Tax=Anaeromusa acidaminophila TaxID=81464 RepID=UPI00037F9C10|nr:transporter substrate-binding domain-containing protein [Anaeromusa acidaminophila]
MRKYGKMIGVLLLMMLALGVLAGCGSDKPTAQKSRIDEIKQKGKLILATGNYRPFEYHDEKTNKIIGYDIDVAEAVAKKIGVPLEVQEMQFTSLIPTLQNGQADLVIAAMYITDQRREVVDFAEPYMDTGMVLVTMKNKTAINSVNDLAGKVVGVKTGATSEKVAQDIKAKGIDFEIKSYKETVDYLLDMENGRLDASINDLLNQLEYNKTHPDVRIVGDPFTKASLGIAVKKGDKELADVVNAVLKDMKQNGEADKLYKKWLTGEK